MNSGTDSRRIATYLCAVLGVIVISLATPSYLDLVAAMGHFVPQDDMATDYVKGLLWAIGLGLSIFLWPVSAADKKCLLWVWLVKCLLTMVLMLFYENYYGSDATMYFGASRGLPSYTGYGFVGGTLAMINLARLHNSLVPDSYHAMKVSCAMIGLIGTYLYFRASVMVLQREDRRLFFLLAFFPGILFWSSILGKDPLVYCAISLYSYGVVGWHRFRSIRYLVSVALGIIAAAVFREWLGPIMLLPMGVFLIKGARSALQRGVLFAFVAFFLAFSANTLVERFQISALQDVVSTVELASGNMSKESGGSTQQLNLDFNSPVSIALFLPVTSFTALFRPLPGEVMNPFGLLAGLESTFLLFLLWRAIRRTTPRELKEPLVIWALLFLLTWALVNGVVSSMNFGLTVRYKLQILPVLLGVLLHLSRKRAQPAPALQGDLRLRLPADGGEGEKR